MVASDVAALDLLDRALRNPEGRPATTDVISNSDEQYGTSASSALRRLRKDRPDLHARELTPHRAMVEAGFRRRTLTVPTDDMAHLANTLRRHLTAE